MITFVAVAYQETFEAHIFCASMLSQTVTDWKAIIFCNGVNPELRKIVDYYVNHPKAKGRILYIESIVNTGYWGCYNRINALSAIDTEYVINTSIQDYYVPIAVEYIGGVLLTQQVDLAFWDCLHNHHNHRIMHSQLVRGFIDWGSFVVKTGIAKAVGINKPQDNEADAYFIEDLLRYGVNTRYINRILTVHN